MSGHLCVSDIILALSTIIFIGFLELFRLFGIFFFFFGILYPSIYPLDLLILLKYSAIDVKQQSINQLVFLFRLSDILSRLQLICLGFFISPNILLIISIYINKYINKMSLICLP